MKRRIICILTLLFLAGCRAPEPEPECLLRGGENLVYDVLLSAGNGGGGKVGTVVLRTEERVGYDGVDEIAITADTQLLVFFVPVKSTLVSTLTKEGLVQRQSVEKDLADHEVKATIFDHGAPEPGDEKACYWRLKDKGDVPPEEPPAILAMEFQGEDYGGMGNILEKKVWSWRDEVPFTGPAYGHLSVLYMLREKDLVVGGEPVTLRTVRGRDIWDLRFTTDRREQVSTPAGEFDALVLKLELEPVNDHARKRAFKGFLGMQAGAELWLDVATKRPVKLQGSLKGIPAAIILREQT